MESNLGHVPFTRSLTECTEAGRHLGPRSAQAWRGARTQGSKRPRAQGLKRPPAKDPDRAIYLSFYLSAGGAPHGPSQHTAHSVTSSHPNPTLCPYHAARNRPQQHRHTVSAPRYRLHTLCTHTQHNPGPHHYDITIIMYQGEKEEKERLERERPTRLQQARVDGVRVRVRVGVRGLG